MRDGEEVRGRWASLALWPVRFAEWLFGPLAPAIDLLLMLFAGGWAVLEIVRPALFDTGAFVGLSWVSDPAWITFHVVLALLHGVGLVRTHWRPLRVSSAFLSSWQWLFVSVSMLRVEVTTGVVAYAILGAWALVGGIYLAGLPPRTVSAG